MIKDLINVKTSHSNGHSHREVAANYRVSMYEKVNVQFTYMVINYSAKPFTHDRMTRYRWLMMRFISTLLINFIALSFKKNVFNINLNLFKKEDSII